MYHYCHTTEEIIFQLTRPQIRGKLLYSRPRVTLRGDIISQAIILAFLKKKKYIFLLQFANYLYSDILVLACAYSYFDFLSM